MKDNWWMPISTIMSMAMIDLEIVIFYFLRSNPVAFNTFGGWTGLLPPLFLAVWMPIDVSLTGWNNFSTLVLEMWVLYYILQIGFYANAVGGIFATSMIITVLLIDMGAVIYLLVRRREKHG